jgi:hypothetical protein
MTPGDLGAERIANLVPDERIDTGARAARVQHDGNDSDPTREVKVRQVTDARRLSPRRCSPFREPVSVAVLVLVLVLVAVLAGWASFS